MAQPCPCQSSDDYDHCCGIYHAGVPAPAPQALMRARYSAYALADAAYIAATWHDDYRPASLDLPDGDRWLGLEVISSRQRDDHGWVHFRAICRAENALSVLEEQSRFVREHGCWLYTDGDHTVSPLKPGRNDACPCGSTRKFKKCCAG